MSDRSKQRIALVIACLLGLGGCATTANVDYLAQADQDLGRHAQWQQPQAAALATTSLTDLIAIAELDQLIEQALAANPGVQQTAVTLAIARAERRVTDADGKPQVAAGIDANLEEDASDSYGSSLTVSWELDLWNKLSDNSQAARLDIESSRANLQAARDALAASVMRVWLQLSRDQQIIAIEQQRLGLLESNEAVILKRYRSGLGDLEELDNAHSSSAASRAALASFQQSLRTGQRDLRLLLGKTAGLETLPVAEQFPEVLTPLAQLPSQDLGRRPDLQQAYAAIEAQQYRTRVAYKALLPSIDLAASLGLGGDSPRDVLLASPVWSLLGGLTAPLFQGGQLRAEAKIAELTTEQRYWAYQETLLTAVNEVEEALDQEQSLALQQQHLADALESARRSATTYKDKYRQGLVDILDLLTVQQQSFDQEIELIQITYNRLANRITLGLALGLGVSA